MKRKAMKEQGITFAERVKQAIITGGKVKDINWETKKPRVNS